MSNLPPSRFTPQNQTTHERLSTNTVGLVALSDFRKRRAEVLEQQEREAREAALAAAKSATPDRSQTSTPANGGENSEAERRAKKQKKKKRGRPLVSFDADDGDEDGVESSRASPQVADKGDKAEKKVQTEAEEAEEEEVNKANEAGEEEATGSGKDTDKGGKKSSKFTANTTVGIVPKALTKAALRREAAEREALRKEFLTLQTAIKATEIAIPFVFYDGTNVPGGVVRLKKGDFVWFFLDKSRKVGAELRVGERRRANIRREWARAAVDDLLLVRGTIIIPHHYEFYFFIMNKTVGPEGHRLFDYSTEAPPTAKTDEGDDLLATPIKGLSKNLPDISTLEGASDDPTFTKVVDRRWYERNKHIYPASMWQEFDPERDYQNEIRRDPGGNAYFFSK